nr:transposase zinc-binding domain-containing protein [Bradyrhizobium icense]
MTAVLEVADIFRRHGEAFRQARTGHLGRVKRRIMGAITACGRRRSASRRAVR